MFSIVTLYAESQSLCRTFGNFDTKEQAEKLLLSKEWVKTSTETFEKITAGFGREIALIGPAYPIEILP